MNRKIAKKQRLENPEKRDKYLKEMKDFSEQISNSLRDNKMHCTCDEEGRLEKEEYSPCNYCSLGQQSAELYDEGVGIEGIDY